MGCAGRWASRPASYIPVVNALTALVAVLVGWLLGFGQQAWRDRREAKLAARLLLDELLYSKAELGNRRDNLEWAAYRPISHRVWETHGSLILRLLSIDVMQELRMADLSIDHADYLSKMIVESQPHLLRVPAITRRRAEQVEESMVRRAKAAVDEVEQRVDRAMVSIAVLAHETLWAAVRRRARAAWRRRATARAPDALTQEGP